MAQTTINNYRTFMSYENAADNLKIKVTALDPLVDEYPYGLTLRSQPQVIPNDPDIKYGSTLEIDNGQFMQHVLLDFHATNDDMAIKMALDMILDIHTRVLVALTDTICHLENARTVPDDMSNTCGNDNWRFSKIKPDEKDRHTGWYYYGTINLDNDSVEICHESWDYTPDDDYDTVHDILTQYGNVVQKQINDIKTLQSTYN